MEGKLKSNYSRMIVYGVLLGDLVILNLLLFITYSISNGFLSSEVSYLQFHLIMSICYLVSGAKDRVVLYHRKARAYQIMANVAINIFITSIISGVVFLSSRRVDIFSLEFVVFFTTSFVLIFIYRVLLRNIIKYWRRAGRNISHCVIVGASSNCVELYKELTEDASSGYRVYGYFAEKPSDRYPEKCKYLGRPGETIAWLKENTYINNLYCALPSIERDTIVPIIDYCENNLVKFYSLPNLHNYLHNRVYLYTIGNVPVLSLRNNPLNEIQNRFIKRAFDIVFSGLFLCTLFPIIFVIVAIITKITMPGPIFFKQKRNGLNDEEFFCYKFRSMKVNADADKVQATKDDPRKTKWGNIMRKTSIDELPQFINVFKGEMSVVGPRPHMLKHTEEYSKLIDKYMVRHFVKPGVTGWSQVTGFRGETKELKDMEGRIRGDIWYIEHWTFWLDMYIIFKTVANAVHGEKNAY